MYLGSAFEAAKVSAMSAAGGALGAVAQLAPHPSAGSHRHTGRGANIAGAVHGNLTIALDLLDAAVASMVQMDVPSIGEALSAYLADEIDLTQLHGWIGLLGGRKLDYQPVIDAARRKPETVESGILRNRQVVDDDGHKALLRQLGFTSSIELEAIRSLRHDVPGPSDLVRFAVRHAFEPELLSALGYHAEYRPALDFYHQTAGLNYKVFTGPLKNTIVATCKEFPEIFKAVQEYAAEEKVAAPGSPDQVPDWFASRYASLKLPEPTWAVMYWWSHWILPSPGQGYTMLQRLRGDPANPATWRVPGVKPFESKDLNLLLRALDYPPFWRDKLEAISYRLLGIRQLRLMIAQAQMDDAEVVEVIRDNGYTEHDAKLYAAAIIGDVRQKDREKKFRAIQSKLNAGWELGIYDDATFLASYQQAGLPSDMGQRELQAAVADRNIRLGKELVGQVRKGYLRGTFNKGQASVFMQQIGIVPPRIAEYIRIWDAMRQAGRKEATAGQLRKAAVEGTLDLASYAQRLRNLDYTDDAINVALADVRVSIADKERRALEKLAKEEEASNKARLAALKALEAQLKAARAELAKSASPSKLKAFWCDGDIELPEVEARLRKLGILDEDIPRWLRECDAKRAKAGLPSYDEAKSGVQAAP